MYIYIYTLVRMCRNLYMLLHYMTGDGEGNVRVAFTHLTNQIIQRVSNQTAVKVSVGIVTTGTYIL